MKPRILMSKKFARVLLPLCALLPSLAVGAGEVRNGGQVIIDLAGHPHLRDLVGKTTCEWKGFAPELAKVQEYPRILETIGKVHWYLAESIREAEKGITDICWVDGPLMNLSETEDKDAVTPYEPDDQPVQIAIRINENVYISRPLFDAADDLTRSYLFFHEISHSFFPLALDQRAMKVRSFVKSVRDQEEAPDTSEAFSRPLRKNGVDISDESKWLNPVREALTDFLAGKLSQQDSEDLAVKVFNLNLGPYLRKHHAEALKPFFDSFTKGKSKVLAANSVEALKERIERGYIPVAQDLEEAIAAKSRDVAYFLLSRPETAFDFKNPEVNPIQRLLARNYRDERGAMTLLNRQDFQDYLTNQASAWSIYWNLMVAMEYASRGDAPLRKLLENPSVRSRLNTYLRDGNGRFHTPLTRAIEGKWHAAIPILLEQSKLDVNAAVPVGSKGTVNETSYYGSGRRESYPLYRLTPLMIAAVLGDSEAITLLGKSPKLKPNLYGSMDFCAGTREDHEPACWRPALTALQVALDVWVDKYSNYRWSDGSPHRGGAFQALLELKGLDLDRPALNLLPEGLNPGASWSAGVTAIRYALNADWSTYGWTEGKDVSEALLKAGASVLRPYPDLPGQSVWSQAIWGGSVYKMKMVMENSREIGAEQLVTLYKGEHQDSGRISALGKAILESDSGLVGQILNVKGINYASPAFQEKTGKVQSALEYAKGFRERNHKTESIYTQIRATKCTMYIFVCL